MDTVAVREIDNVLNNRNLLCHEDIDRKINGSTNIITSIKLFNELLLPVTGCDEDLELDPIKVIIDSTKYLLEQIKKENVNR